MKRAWMALVVVAALALPASAVALGPPPAAKNAAKYCKALRAELGADFKAAYGEGKNAFGKCVSARVHDERQNRRAAVRACKQQFGPSKHSLRHEGGGKGKGRKGHGRKAFARCVAKKLRHLSESDTDDVLNAAKKCKAERAADPEAFDGKYGTDENDDDAFGECVSQNADDEPGEDADDDNDGLANPADDDNGAENEPGDTPDSTEPDDPEV